MRRGFLKLIFLGGLLIFGAALEAASPENPEMTMTSVDLIECGDKKLEFKILCNPRWPTQRNTQSLKLIIDATAQAEVAVTIYKSEEVGLTFSDLTPTALKRVFEYSDEFKYARTFVNRQKAVRVEAQPLGQPETHLLDYFFIRDSHLYRISYAARNAGQFRKYLPLFAEMMRSFEFIHLNF
ncbi:MAG TPA: hypothetical protein PLT76_10095 [Candidatus Omnitrophota bacterium]|nr:hypothetical protein [Candidatus Omnitrophota bacterium]HPB67548.1 hypothetical protein [Candidatus Omnitrophota bacterium]HQO59051.1 hypothetical protein [Candidatus Omnitrophota bacterium]HQP12728.1 hypothetical protein [Candidatus Omnitrophota bacterium]